MGLLIKGSPDAPGLIFRVLSCPGSSDRSKSHPLALIPGQRVGCGVSLLLSLPLEFSFDLYGSFRASARRAAEATAQAMNTGVLGCQVSCRATCPTAEEDRGDPLQLLDNIVQSLQFPTRARSARTLKFETGLS